MYHNSFRAQFSVREYNVLFLHLNGTSKLMITSLFLISMKSMISSTPRRLISKSALSRPHFIVSVNFLNKFSIDFNSSSDKKRGQQHGSKGHGRRHHSEVPAQLIEHRLSPEERRCPTCGGDPMAEFFSDTEVRTLVREMNQACYFRTVARNNGKAPSDLSGFLLWNWSSDERIDVNDSS